MRLTFFVKFSMKENRWIYNLFKTIYFKKYDYLPSQAGASFMFLLIIILIKVFQIYSWNINIFINILGVYFLFNTISGLLLAVFEDRIKSIVFTDEDPTSIITHQTENLQEYEDLKTHYALHNIKNATKNMDWALKSLDIQNFTAQDLEDLNNNIKRIYDTLDDFNKLNNIREQKEFKVQELADIFNKLIRPSVKTKEIKFSFIYQNEDYSDFNVEQNFYDVFQIFNNLIINAEKAMETVSTKELNILVGDFDGTNLCFYVRDTGIGINKESRKKVFKESFSTTGGTGIGLMYIRDELKKMEGEITLLESNEQFSTIFEVKIPINLQ
jgi:signal transduction histidine kinase